MSLHSGLDATVLIIGCGISGIGAAQKLIRQGFRNVRIIEATARSGGRVKTGRLGKRENCMSVAETHTHSAYTVQIKSSIPALLDSARAL